MFFRFKVKGLAGKHQDILPAMLFVSSVKGRDKMGKNERLAYRLWAKQFCEMAQGWARAKEAVALMSERED